MQDLSDWRVLAIDDEPDNLGVVELVLSFYNAKVRTALNGPDGLKLLEQEAPNVLLLDIQMPGMSGFEVLSKIRAREAWNDIPVIAITAHAMAGDQERILASGFDGYISKPISAMSLVDEIMALISTKVNRL